VAEAELRALAPKTPAGPLALVNPYLIEAVSPLRGGVIGYALGAGLPELLDVAGRAIGMDIFLVTGRLAKIALGLVVALGVVAGVVPALRSEQSTAQLERRRRQAVSPLATRSSTCRFPLASRACTTSLPPQTGAVLVDGQHRFYGLQTERERLRAKDPLAMLGYDVPVVFSLGLSRDEEMDLFFGVNGKAKSVPTDLVAASATPRRIRLDTAECPHLHSSAAAGGGSACCLR
jgi:hypothetical protein